MTSALPPPPSPPPTGPLLAVGVVVKPHGLRGEVVVSLGTDRLERVSSGSELHTAEGRVLVVEASRPHQGRFVVRFAGVDSIEDADALRSTELFAPPLDVPGALWVHELVGATVTDALGADLGTVEAVQANPASDLLVLSTGALVPLRFVVEHQPGERVVVDVPEGLFDL